MSGAEDSSSNSSSSSKANGSRSSVIMTRKRRLVHEVEASLAMAITPYWEVGATGVDEHGEGTDREGRDEGTPRRSRRGRCIIFGRSRAYDQCCASRILDAPSTTGHMCSSVFVP